MIRRVKAKWRVVADRRNMDTYPTDPIVLYPLAIIPLFAVPLSILLHLFGLDVLKKTSG